MISSRDLKRVPLFAAVDEPELKRLARRAADIRLEVGQWLVREGEDPRFFVVLEGELETTKNVVGEHQVLGCNVPGNFSGETSIFMGTASMVSIRATTACRVACFDRQQLQELIRNSPRAGEIIFRMMTDRLSLAQKLARETPTALVRVIGSSYDSECRQIRMFLAANRIQFNWDQNPTGQEEHLAVFVRGIQIEMPSARRVAEALGFQTVPEHGAYDIIIAGAGPAGLAAAVCSASEGLRVLLVERFTAGGQAGTSSRIENYLGFPAGLSGNELTERALQQAKKFGVEVLVHRSVQEVRQTHIGLCIELDGGDRLDAQVLLLATGVSWHRLNFRGHDKQLGRGIFYGASRLDGIAVTGQRVFIVGGGNSAGQAAIFYSGYASEVVMVLRGEGLTQSMSQYLVEQLEGRPNVSIEPYTEVISASGMNHLERVGTIHRPPDGPAVRRTREVNALFIMIGATAKTE